MTAKKATPAPPAQTIPAPLLDRLSRPTGALVTATIVFLTLVVFYRPLVFQQLEPAGGDRLASIGLGHQIKEYTQKTGETVLWNPHIFCGIPIYYNLDSRAFHLDRLIGWLDPVLDWRVGWFLLAAIGMYLLIDFLGLPWYLGLTATLALLFFPHFQALIIVGHNFKIRAICAIPLVLYGFLRTLRRRDLFSVTLFALAFGLQLRTKHYQIIFYTLLLLLAVGLKELVQLLQLKAWRQTALTGLLVLGALAVGVFMAAQPLFIAGEYSPYSTRGGQAIVLNAEPSSSSSGVSFDYATQWSLHPAEMMTLIVPRFFGGTSQEVYTGKAFPQLRNRELPGYWGDMPFTQSSEYFGVLVVILACAGIWFYRRDGLVIALAGLLVFAFLLAFGRHFAPLYRLLFHYLPYFSKFRVPSMILNLIFFITIILAAYGFKALLEELTAARLKAFAVIAGFFLLTGLIPLIIPGLLSFTSARDAQYGSDPRILEMLITIRREMFTADTLRMMLFIILFSGVVIARYYRKITPEIVFAAVFILITVDLISVSHRFFGQARLTNPANIERQYFRAGPIDQQLSTETEPYRILGLGAFFQSNDLAYRHSLVGGYSAIKPQLIQDLIDNCLYLPERRNDPLNWSVINMTNSRFILASQHLPYAHTELLLADERNHTYLHRNRAALPRAYFTPEVTVLADETAVLRRLNAADFDPSRTALVSNGFTEDTRFDATGQAAITDYTPNRITLSAVCPAESFLVLAETYYPAGWRALVDGRETAIYQVNHLLRGIRVPAGDHTLEWIFRPASYTRSAVISAVFIYAAWLLLGLGAMMTYRPQWIKRIFRRTAG